VSTKRELRAAAQALEPPTSEESEAVVTGVVEHLRPIPRSAILVYLSMDGELPAERVADRLAGAHRFLTTRTPDVGWLTVHDFDADREIHRFGYQQPVADALQIDPREVDLVLVPGLCFDRTGGRVGWGKGYYDQLLASMRPEVGRIGLTLERRLVPAVPREPHDVAMTHIATELGVSPVTLAV
jgi:5-formyltetrahydrofolate cyclo-ligase